MAVLYAAISFFGFGMNVAIEKMGYHLNSN
jgi:hypothetical protein